MYKFNKKQLLALSILFNLLLSYNAFADLSLSSITESQLNDIMKDFSADFAHTSVSSSSALGKLWGFELGFVGTQSAANKTKSVVDNVSPGTFDGKLYSAGLLGKLGVPMGFTAELEIIPTTNISSGSVSYNSLAVAWDAKESGVIDSIVSLGFKAYRSDVSFSYSQNFNSPPGTTATVTMKNTITGLQAFVSKDLIVFQPYIGYGIANSSGSLSTSAGNNFFNSSFTSASSANTTLSSAHLTIGTEVKLLIFKLGLEYSSLFDTSRYSAKFAFYF